jgi:hypothetical protein
LHSLRTFLSLALLAFAFTSARADDLITNGGFESGSLAGWTATGNGDGGFTVTSASSTPVTGNAAVSDDFNGGQTQYLTQSFTTPGSFGSATLTFSMFVNDIYGLDFGSSGDGGQVSLLSASGALLQVLYGPTDTFENPVGSPNSYFSFSQDIARYLVANTTYSLQFSSSDSTSLINVGVDDVSLVTGNVAATPEPSTLSLSAIGGCLVFFVAYRKAKGMDASNSGLI